MSSFNKYYSRTFYKEGSLLGTGDLTMGNYTKSLLHHRCHPAHRTRAGRASMNTLGLERNAVIRESDRRTASLGRWGDSGGEEVGRARSYGGLENHVKTSGLHLKTNGQLSKDFKLVSGMRFSFHSVWSFPAVIASTGRYPMVPYKGKLLSCSFSTPFLILPWNHSLSGYSST